jgi:hypothetical protein
MSVPSHTSGLSQAQLDEIWALHAHSFRVIDTALGLKAGTARSVVLTGITAGDDEVLARRVDADAHRDMAMAQRSRRSGESESDQVARLQRAAEREAASIRLRDGTSYVRGKLAMPYGRGR